jgi:hypothetical protein
MVASNGLPWKILYKIISMETFVSLVNSDLKAERMKNYEEQKVVDQLKRNPDLDIQGKVIRELTRENSKGTVGIKTKGKLDFLSRNHGYVHYFVDKFD